MGKYQEYAKLRNQVKNSVKKAKMSMERDIVRDVKKNPKKFQKYANSKRKTKSEISELRTNTENGVKITENDRDKTEVLAGFFSSVFTKEPEGEIHNLQPKETKFRCAERQIEEKEVLKLMLDINPNKSPGPGGIHPNALKETAASFQLVLYCCWCFLFVCFLFGYRPVTRQSLRKRVFVLE